MLRRIRWIFREQGRFFPPPRSCRPPRCVVRPLQESDRDACEQIYLLNETARFPRGYFDHFCKMIFAANTATLVIESDSQVRALATIRKQQVSSRLEVAQMSFGMVHPQYQRQGFGTTLLLARIAILPPPVVQWYVHMTTTGGSDSYYRRFGFVRTTDLIDDRDVRFQCLIARFSRSDWMYCRSWFDQSHAVLNAYKLAVPEGNFVLEDSATTEVILERK